MCWDGVCSRPPASGFLAVRLPAGPFALPAQATLWGGVPFKEAPASLPTSDPGLVHGNHTPLPHCPQGQGSVGPAQSRLLGPVLTFPQTLKGARKPAPPRSPSHSPGGEGEATVCPPPQKGTGDVGTQPPANPLSPGKPSDLSFRGWKWGGASADRWSFTFSELDLHGVSAPHMERGLLSL